uniref:Protein-L-isoaspartate O-methyltransferase n=1 Tax=Alexandrium monilatum TaxID=311494 RepID=A0A7S4W878_9DINO
MADSAPWFVFMNQRDEMRGLPASNAAMVEELVHSGSLRSQDCISAFQAIDRQHFWPADSGELAYADMPLRSGRLHLSAPHIYAKALESLMPLKPGMSFLNVGSGTGYFNSIISELTGELATNHGIDIWSETVVHAVQRCRLLGKTNIEFTLGNAYQLNINETMRYDRIYLGACANSRSKYLYRLLEVGGVLIGPFQVGQTQQLRRVFRQTETLFSVEVLGSVQFASLIEPVPSSPRAPTLMQSEVSQGQSGVTTPRLAGEEGGQLPVGLPGVPFTFSLCERPWTPERCWLYPASYRRTVAMGLLCKPRDHSIVCLPTEIWVKHIFPWCPKWWFEDRYAQAPRPLAATAAPHKKACRGRDAQDDAESDDACSTRAPSSAVPSVQTTPESGPSRPPAGIEVDEEEQSNDALDLGDVCFEVFGDGQRHAIGADHDPDDAMEPDEGHRLVPLRVLQLLAEDARRRRRRRRQDRRDEEEEEAQGEDEDEDVAEDEDENEEMLQEERADDAGSGAVDQDQDDDMQDAEDSETEAEEEAEAADVPML